jgi:diacylglycerol kinase (ATP)
MISLVLILFDFGFLYISKAIIFLSMFIPIIAEVINSAIERVVDLVTLEYHDMAKRAKDMGSLIVFMSFVFMICIWGVVVYYELVIR